MRQSFKNTLQPLEKALKKAFGIRKERKGQIFDSRGIVCDSKEKITQYILFIPLFQKIRVLVNVSEFSNGAIATNTSMGGESQNFNAPKSTLYTIKTTYRLLGIPLFFVFKTTLNNTNKKHTLSASIHTGYSTNIGEYVATNPNIESEIFALIKDLDSTSKALVLRQIALSLKAYKANNPTITELTTDEIAELSKINAEFYPNILELGANLYAYNGYLLPKNDFEISVFWHKHNLNILEPQTLVKMRGKDFIDVGGYIGDSAIIFEREFCDKNIYSFEATRANFRLMQRTLELNNSKRIVPINKGLGANNSTMQICIAESGSSIVAHNSDEMESMEIITLDEFVKEHKIAVGFIKVDIEGFEMEFLKGAKETICAQKPAMLISIYHQPSDYFGIKPLIESWNLGYKFKIHKGVDFNLTVESALFCEVIE